MTSRMVAPGPSLSALSARKGRHTHLFNLCWCAPVHFLSVFLGIDTIILPKAMVCTVVPRPEGKYMLFRAPEEGVQYLLSIASTQRFAAEGVAHAPHIARAMCAASF